MSTSASLKALKQRRQLWARLCMASLLCALTYLFLPPWSWKLPSISTQWIAAAKGQLPLGVLRYQCHTQTHRNMTRGDDWNFWETQAQYAPFLTARNALEEILPEGCEIDQVTLLHRHTARYPTVPALRTQGESLKVIFDSPLLNNDTLYAEHPELNFLKEFADTDGKLSADRVTDGWRAEKLTDMGRRSAYDSGRTLRQRYKPLLDTANPDRPLFTRSSSSGRVVESAGYWLMGYRGEEFRLPEASDDEQTGKKALEQVDVVMLPGRNSTLKVRTCRNWEQERRKYDYTRSPGHSKYLSLAATIPMRYLSDMLDLPIPLDTKDYIAIMSLCAYSASAKSLEELQEIHGGSEDEAMEAWYRSVEVEKGGWCGIFAGLRAEEERRVWEEYAYLHDLNKHHDRSTGGRYGPSMGVGYVNELLARLQDRKPIDETSTNKDLDDNEATFPRGGRRMFVDFGHDNEMIEVLAAMGIMTDIEVPLTGPPPGHRDFMQQRLTPFGAVFAFQRISCPVRAGTWAVGGPGREHFVRIFINNVKKTVKHEACASSRYNDSGLCAMEALVESQAFSRTGGHWARCFE